MKDYIYKIKFKSYTFDGEDWHETKFEILTDILLFNHNFMIINDLNDEYFHQWEINQISDLTVEFIEKEGVK